MHTVTRLAELAELVELDVPVYLRYSPGPEADAVHPSVDHESGLAMPGHSANPLRPPGWWTLPTEDWLARAVCQYRHKIGEGARPWVLTGVVVDVGPDNEPLLVAVRPLAWLAPELLTEAHDRYRARMKVGNQT
ncbi:DUF6098 family protein [Actinophytocola sp.]|uniref:DUF6098 family protein n=1 Tax=Actinophytocola sp. TaxID=1872138 RepID=UPI002D7F651F|nr:DUF6098 family protein [Actinophytocola sp.]HET9141090.1 DUF6098 family protein [Actinophytocola sp.]